MMMRGPLRPLLVTAAAGAVAAAVACAQTTTFDECPAPIACYEAPSCAASGGPAPILVCAPSCAARGLYALVACYPEACAASDAPTLVCASCDPATGAGCTCPAGTLADGAWRSRCRAGLTGDAGSSDGAPSDAAPDAR